MLHDALHGQIPFLTDTPTIIFGAYVAHPGLGENATSSIAAVCSCQVLDKIGFTKFFRFSKVGIDSNDVVKLQLLPQT